MKHAKIRLGLEALMLCLVLVMESPALAQSTTAPSKITEKQIDSAVQKIKYKTVGDVELNLHVFYPEGHQVTDRRPAIVFFFGGGWVGGSPKQFYKQAWYLSRRGMVAACAEYRIHSKHKTSPIECVKDGKSAIRYVRENADKLGVDPKKIVAGGGSAGGHVAAATATVTKFNESTDSMETSAVPCALILFNPVLDNGPDGWGHKKVKEYWKDISPIHNIKKPSTPTLFMLGSKDKLLPVSVGQRYHELVVQNDGKCELKVTQDAGHGYFNRGEDFLDTLEATDDFLVTLGILKGTGNVRESLKHLATKKKAQKKSDAKKSKR